MKSNEESMPDRLEQIEVGMALVGADNTGESCLDSSCYIYSVHFLRCSMVKLRRSVSLTIFIWSTCLSLGQVVLTPKNADGRHRGV